MITIEDALGVLDRVLQQDRLTHLQEVVFRCAWEGLTYEQIATAEDYDPDYIKLVGAQLWQLLSDRLGQRVTKSNFRVAMRQFTQVDRPKISTVSQTLIDWGEAVDVSGFCGRSQELETLDRALTEEQCRFVTILGMGGIGKTVLSVKLAQQVQGKFEAVIWRSLQDAPPLDVILSDWIPFLSRQQETELPDTVDGKLARLMHYLRSSRCLLILDNVESILEIGDRAGHYPIGYESYGELFRRIGETVHQSCLVLTSREKPKEVAALEGQFVRSIRLEGLDTTEAGEFLKPKQLEANSKTFQRFINLYGGNPLALKIAASTIQDLFDSDVSEFLTQGTAVFGGISDLLDEQFDRLSDLEQQIMYWIAIDRDGASLSELAEDLVPAIPKRQLIEALASLARRPIVEKRGSKFTQQPVVMEYVIDRFIDRIYQEFCSESFQLLMSHALIKATVEDHIRDRQIRMIMQPLVDRLTAPTHCHTDLEDKLKNVLVKLRQHYGCAPGYAAGNILNLLCCLKTELTNYDFSGLAVWQAQLQGVSLHQVNFANADLKKSVFSETLGNVWSVAFSPDGATLAASDTAGTIHLWNVLDGQKILTCDGHQHWVCEIAFSSDGNLIVSASGDNTVKIWSAKTGGCLRTLTEHQDWVISIAVSPTAPILASSSADRTIRLWDLHTGKLLKVLEGHQHWICKIAFSPDGRTIASGSDDRTIKLWDVQSGDCLKTIEGHTNTVRGVAFSPDGTMLASGSEDATIKLWEIETSNCIRTLAGHLDQVRCVNFSPDGTLLLSGSFDETIKLWDLASGKCLKTLQQHRGVVRSTVFSPTGNMIASGSADQSVRLWHTQTGECCKTLQGYTNFVLSVEFSFDNQYLASTSTDQTVNLWDSKTGACVSSFYGHENWVWTVAFSPDDQLLASGSFDHTIRVWDRSTNQCLKVLRGHTNWVWSVAFSPNGTTLASGSFDQTIRLWNPNTGECLHILAAQSRIWSIAYSPDGEFLASGEENHLIHLWNPHTGQCLQTLEGHTNRVMSIAFSADGKRLVSGSEDGTVRIWDLKSGQCESVFQSGDRIMSVAFSEDSHYIASGGVDQTVRVWNLKSGDCQILRGHLDRIWSVKFDRDSSILASGSEDQTVRLWNVETGECVKVLQKPQPYDGMNITNVSGITNAQKTTLKALGAIDVH
ncbi:NB-ARC domain-containing protein [Leptolyngbya sp. AN03gr2]|uniref:NACHT and WD40 repeat domain-containing protein n=1 Tax=unclassified Leptolyngbya TaxID=2650499 RepID=UPI003D31C21F